MYVYKFNICPFTLTINLITNHWVAVAQLDFSRSARSPMCPNRKLDSAVVEENFAERRTGADGTQTQTSKQTNETNKQPTNQTNKQTHRIFIRYI